MFRFHSFISIHYIKSMGLGFFREEYILHEYILHAFSSTCMYTNIILNWVLYSIKVIKSIHFDIELLVIQFKAKGFFFFQLRQFFKSSFRITEKLRVKNRDYTLFLYVHNFCTPPEWYICYNWLTYITIVTWKLGFPLVSFEPKDATKPKIRKKTCSK